ncbi:MAG: peptidase T [Paludibacteraceae bacterium]|nr:peptidase T [Paludibacteraceae bacterium]
MDKNERYDGLVERFLHYVSFDTQSDEASETCPSTAKQLKLGAYLKEELEKIGLKEVEQDAWGYVYATLPENQKGQPTIGLIAHLDTSPDANGNGIKAKIVYFDGQPIVLNEQKGITLNPTDYPEMLKYKGQELIVTDGTTLLGADDKAGIAEIVTTAAYLTQHPEIKHGTIKIAFTPDEEIGRGSDKFDVKKFRANWAYTIDGGEIGELEYENFNAASANIVFNGRNIHPGSAKDRMVNASKLAMEFNSMLPANEVPEHTEGREGFFHLTHMDGCVENATLSYIVRDHDSNRFARRKEQLEQIATYLQHKYGEKAVEITINDQYRNMIEQISPVMHIVERAEKAMRQAGIEPVIQPVRGGTDGAQLSFMGLPCPNLFAGGLNFHGRFEFVPIPSLHAAVSVILNIVAPQQCKE